jgi:hypothetical protein
MPIITTIRGNTSPFGKRFIKPLGLGSTGGTITTSGGYRIHTFSTGTQSGTTSTFFADADGLVDVFLIGGGGGGGGRSGGGGGAGGAIYITNYAIQAGNISVTVGNGADGGTGAGNEEANAPTPQNGGNSIFGTLTALGGGYGGSDPVNTGAQGGCGGGAKYGVDGSNGIQTTSMSISADSRLYGYGFKGGFGFSNPYAGGGGGGIGGVGVAGTSGGEIGDGGPGLAFSISGTSVYYGGGGGGGSHNPANGRGFGGIGGGGNGGAPGGKNSGSPGTDGLGAGGGAGSTDSSNGGSGGRGGSGIVIVRYAI